MFFKNSVFKKMLKEAYKSGGLTVGHMESVDEHGEITEGYYLSSGWWIMWVDFGMMPKEAKAAIIELCGDLPRVGEVFKALKGGNQYEIEMLDSYNLPEIFTKCNVRFNVTNTLLQQGDKFARVLQGNETGYITSVNERFMELIDDTAVNYDGGETQPVGPVALRENSTFVYWGNNCCYLAAGVRIPKEDTNEEKYFKFLSQIKLD